MADLDLREIHDFMITIAKQAGARITSAQPSTSSSGSKKNCPLRPWTPHEPH
jgi:myo-inositol-1(or 4)-monophosphatase